jgi:hypothetical protein
MNIFFTDFFQVNEEEFRKYGAFNISLINDLPLFIDPFLLFGSDKREYQNEHIKILKYLAFLKEKTENKENTTHTISSWYQFPEVKQNWFGYSGNGNSGRGLGPKFARAFSTSIHFVFDDIGKEVITQSSHLEKVGLFQIGIGRDNISDFSTNLLKHFLLEYTQTFSKQFIKGEYLEIFNVEKVYFNYDLEKWMSKEFLLPKIDNDFVLLCPKDLLTKDENWINSKDLRGDFTRICNSIPNNDLKEQIFNYFRKKLPAKKPNQIHTPKERSEAIQATIQMFPDIIKFFVKQKEENKKGAQNISEQKVDLVDNLFVKNVSKIVELLVEQTEFYSIPSKSAFEESLKRVFYLKDVIEKNDGYRMFYVKGVPIKREADLQIIYKLTWFASDYDVNREPNNGRGPADYTISKGAKNKTIVEFKLASNSKLRQNLENQVKVYKEANNVATSIVVILYFDNSEYANVVKIINDLGLKKSSQEFIVLIDAGKKISASNVK